MALVIWLRYLVSPYSATRLAGFFGAWLGGITLVRSGSYEWIWYADIILASAAALVNLPIREAHPKLSVMVA